MSATARLPSTADPVRDQARFTMWQLLERAAALVPDRDAVVDGERVLSYGELVRRARCTAARLRALGIGESTRVGFVMQTCTEWTQLHYALMLLGATAIPISMAYEPRELRHVLATARPQHLILIDQYRDVDYLAKFQSLGPAFVDGADGVDASEFDFIQSVTVLAVDESGRMVPTTDGYRRLFDIDHIAPVEGAGPATADDPAYVIYTSGSTAFPKPALLAHRCFTAAGTGYAVGLDLTPDDRLLMMLPTFHITGPMMLTVAHGVGAAVHVTGHFEPRRMLDEIERGRCTATIGFPTNMTKIMGDPSFATRDLSSFTKATLGGTPAYLLHVSKAFGLQTIGTIYGSTESAGLVSGAEAGETDLPTRIETNGKPLSGVDVRIVDPETGAECTVGVPGEICFRGVVRFIEYLPGTPGADDAIDADGFFHSGDYGFVDDRGYLYYRGRYKMMIKTGGENVAEHEVEMFLEEELDDVEVAQVVGVPDEVWGEAIVAFVQLRDGTPPVTSDELRAECAGKIARFKIPKRFVQLAAADWPVLANGRQDKATLRTMANELT